MQPNDQQPTGETDTNVSPAETVNTENIASVQPAEATTATPTVTLNTETPTAVQPAETITPPTETPTTTSESLAPVSGVSNPPVAPAPVTQRSSRFGFLKSKKAKLTLLIIAVLVVLGAGSAGAYYGVIVPNKPENVLKTAITNTLKEKQFNYDGTVDLEAADSTKADAMKATSVTYKGGADLDKQAMKAELNVTVTGIKVQGEIRYVDQTAYFKLGDLGAIKNLATAYSPEASGLISKVENQWIEVDKTLLKEAKADCALNTKLTVSDQEIQSLFDAYSKNPFATISSTSSEAVNGNAATKFELSLNDDKMIDYGKNLNDLSVVKALKGCSSDVAQNTKVEKDGDTTPLTVWVDKATKHIVKIASHSTDRDAKKDNIKGTASITLNYSPVTVEKPANAKPLLNLISEFAPLFNGGVQGADSENPFSLLGV